MLNLTTIPEELVHRICSELCLPDVYELRATCTYLQTVVSNTPVMKDLRVQGWDRFERMRSVFPRVSVALALGSEDYVENVDALMAKHACYINGLDLYNSRLDEVSNFVHLLRGIQSLDISFNNVQSFPNWLCHLYTLRIGSNPLRSLDAICRLTSLRLLDLSYLTRPSDVLTEAQTGPLSNLMQLATLSLAGNALLTIPSFVSSLSRLSTLYLQDNNLTSLLPLACVPAQPHKLIPVQTRTYGIYAIDKCIRLVGAQSLPHLESTATYMPAHAVRTHTEEVDTDVRDTRRDDVHDAVSDSTARESPSTGCASNEQPTVRQPLRGLRKLNINSNKIAALPADISVYHPHLHVLLASDNRLETLDSLVQLRELKELDVSSNWLTYKKHEQSVKESEVVYRTVLNDCPRGKCLYAAPGAGGASGLTYTQAWKLAGNKSQLRLNELRVYQMLHNLRTRDVRYNHTDIEKWMEWQGTEVHSRTQLSARDWRHSCSQMHSVDAECLMDAEAIASSLCSSCGCCCCCSSLCTCECKTSKQKEKEEYAKKKKEYGVVERVWYAEAAVLRSGPSLNVEQTSNTIFDSLDHGQLDATNRAA